MKKVIQTWEQLLNLRGSKGQGTDTTVPSHAKPKAVLLIHRAETLARAGCGGKGGGVGVVGYSAGHYSISQLCSFRIWGKFLAWRERGANELCNHPWGRQDPPGPHYLCLVEFKLPSPASAINPSPALRYFPMKASLKKKIPITFFGDVHLSDGRKPATLCQ